MTRTPIGTIDGVRVALFEEGSVYDLPAALACVLVCEGWADFVPDASVSSSRRERSRAIDRQAAADDPLK
jgi:hypothetical protein